MSTIVELEGEAQEITADIQQCRERVAEQKARLAEYPYAQFMSITPDERKLWRLERELGRIADLLTVAWKKKED
jgi:hypothetical protein